MVGDKRIELAFDTYPGETFLIISPVVSPGYLLLDESEQ